MLAPSGERWPPNYTRVYAFRRTQLRKLAASPKLLLGAREFYKHHPVEFINHWCDTFDPRNVALGNPARVPFVLFPRQREFVQFITTCLWAETSGLTEKSRDMGATWVAVCVSVWLWLYWPGADVGWGSYNADLVDKIGVIDSIFEKIRTVIRGLPPIFLPAGFSDRDHLMYMRVVNPENNSSITGAVGDNMGRGGRKLIYFKDESAHYEHAEMIEAALTDNTRVQMDLSSVHGLGTVFHRKREAGTDWEPGQEAVKGRTNVFVMDWRDHPEKTQAWHDERERDARDKGLLHVFAQEVDRNYAASVEGVIIAPEWVTASIDAHVKLRDRQPCGLEGQPNKVDLESGMWGAALDVADEGLDTNALARRKGCVLKSVSEWGERDTGATARRAINACREVGPILLQYDCVGVGAGVKAEANRLTDERLMPPGVRLVPWAAGAAVEDPEGRVIPGDKNSPLNKDFYLNLKAQAWWSVARKFEHTWRAVTEPGFRWDPEMIISVSSSIPLLRKLQKELSQATATTDNSKMKLQIVKAPEGTKSPNCADAVIMAFFPLRAKGVMRITPEALAWSARR